jgi:hypothetical protein
VHRTLSCHALSEAAPGTPSKGAVAADTTAEKAKKSHTTKPLPPGAVEEPKPKTPCPHCGKEFERLHFHKCKKAPKDGSGSVPATSTAAKSKAAKAPAAGTVHACVNTSMHTCYTTHVRA